MLFSLPNVLTVLGAALAAFVVGFLMHGPIAGKLWMRINNVVPTGNEKFSDMYGKMFWNFVANVATATALTFVYVLAATSPLFHGQSLGLGLLCAFVAWAGFLFTSSSMGVIWMKQSYKSWLFEAFCSLLVLLTMGAIIAIA